MQVPVTISWLVERMCVRHAKECVHGRHVALDGTDAESAGSI